MKFNTLSLTIASLAVSVNAQGTPGTIQDYTDCEYIRDYLGATIPATPSYAETYVVCCAADTDCANYKSTGTSGGSVCRYVYGAGTRIRRLCVPSATATTAKEIPAGTVGYLGSSTAAWGQTVQDNLIFSIFKQEASGITL